MARTRPGDEIRVAQTRWASARNRNTPPDAAVVAGIYRELRKGLEDGKDEPGAADFYFGEMELRRASGRSRDSSSAERSTPFSERRLLDVYWLTSGYGLRASRSIIAFLGLLALCAVLFTHPAFGRLPVPAVRASSVNSRTGAITYAAPPGTPTTHRVSYSRALEFTARESLTITRTTGSTSLVDTTGRGAALDIGLRLLAPILVGFAALALRGRTKR